MGFGREMDGCGQFMKYSLFFANFIIFIGGCVVLGIGIWIAVDRTYANELLGTNLFLGAVYILIITGAIVVLIAFLGCLGAVKEIRCMLLMYFMIVFLIFVTMLVGGILGYVFREKVSSTIGQEMLTSIKLYKSNEAVTRAWDETQRNLKCCGVNSPKDWESIITLPASCCSSEERTLVGVTCSELSPLLNTQGCRVKTEQFIKQHATIVGGAGIGVACLMLLGMIFSCALFKLIE